MTEAADDKLPDAAGRPDRARDNRAGREIVNALYVESLHYHTNDLAELRRIAETDASLAHKIVDADSDRTRRQDGSFRIGLVLTTGLAIFMLGTGAYILVRLGVVQTLAFIFAMLGVSFLLRVVLTGEWSETSWVGKFLGRRRDDD